MMDDATLVSLIFDETVGPIIESIQGPLQFTDTVCESIKLCAFPESVLPLTTKCHVYTFAINNLHCHCCYIKVTSEGALRGFNQFSFVIVTKQGINMKFLSLLRSISSILDLPFSQIASSLSSMLLLWQKMSHTDYPLFNGLLTPQSESSDVDIWRDLKCENLESIWEKMILNEPILVLGATPEFASRAVEALTGTLKGSSFCQVIPYISITDPRFRKLAAAPKGVIGVSNPMASQLMKDGVHVIKVGFPRQNQGTSWCFRHSPYSKSRQTRLEENTKLLISAIQDTLMMMEKTSPGSANACMIDVDILKREIADHKVMLIGGLNAFTEKLVNARGFRMQYKQCLSHAHSSISA